MAQKDSKELKQLKKLSLLAEVACDYYERKLNQDEIAEKLFLSRTRVSRLLKEAEEEGIVTFQVNYTFERHYELEERLKNRFGIKHSRVLNNRISDKTLYQRDVCKLGSEYLMDHIKKNMIIGTGWGESMSILADLLQPMDLKPDIVQLMGAIACDSISSTPQAIVTSLAENFNGHADFMNLPLFIKDDYVRQALCNDPTNAVTIKKGIFCDKIIASIGTMDKIKDSNYWRGGMPLDQYQDLINKGAVGSVLGRFFDANGQEIDCEWNRKSISLSIRQLKNISDVVIVAATLSKAPALLAALKGGFITTLITDGSTATKMLNER